MRISDWSSDVCSSDLADGYLGFAKSPAGDLKSRVDAINIKRRAFYTDLAAKRGVTVQEVAAATACELFQTRVVPGEASRSENGAWLVRGRAPAQLPRYRTYVRPTRRPLPPLCRLGAW